LNNKSETKTLLVPCLICLVALLLIGLIIALSVLLHKGSKEAASQSPNKGLPTSVPVAFPPPLPTLTPAFRTTPHPSTQSPTQAVSTRTTLPTLRPSFQSPEAANYNFTLVGEFVGTSSGHLGVDVAMTDSYMAGGDSSGYGYVNIYRLFNAVWSPLYTVFGQQDGSFFGTSIDWSDGTNSTFVVGAPGTYALSTQTPIGAVYFYKSDYSGTIFSQVGPTIRGDQDVYSIGEFFGFSVAASSNNIVAVGAPSSNKGNVTYRGRVYTFQFNAALQHWTPRSPAWVVGPSSEDRLGSAVDLSYDGNVLVAGAPGRNDGSGAIFIYAWTGAEWNLSSNIESSVASEAFGSSVKILSSDARYIAAGAPRFFTDAGIVRVYGRSNNDAYELIGSITGVPGDSLGDTNSIGGTAAPDLVVFVATKKGYVKRFRINPVSGLFVQIGDSVLTGYTSAPLAISSNGTSFVVGGKNQVAIYAGI